MKQTTIRIGFKPRQTSEYLLMRKTSLKIGFKRTLSEYQLMRQIAIKIGFKSR